jgi:hypothetical protein
MAMLRFLLKTAGISQPDSFGDDMDLERKTYAIDLIINILQEHGRALEELASKAERLVELGRRKERE